MKLPTSLHVQNLPHDVYAHTKINEFFELTSFTKKAIFIKKGIEQYWIPLSVLCVDKLGDLWVQNWFLVQNNINLKIKHRA